LGSASEKSYDEDAEDDQPDRQEGQGEYQGG
jgi:hypothetical protein